MLLKGEKAVTIKLAYLANKATGPFIRRALRNYGFQLLALAQLRSPVGMENGGRFKGAWQVNDYRATGLVAGIIISNPMPYAGVLEHGSKEGQKPWPHAGPRTVNSGGKVFSSQAPGGVLGPILPKITSDAAEHIYNVIKG